MTNLDNAGLGFLLVTVAGLSTALGAMLVFWEKAVRLANKRVLAAGLGFSGGVMLYVSFVEILVKSQLAFTEAQESEENAYLSATACFFAGMVILRVLVWLVHRLDKDHSHGVCEGNIDTQRHGVNAETAGGTESAPDPVPDASQTKDSDKDSDKQLQMMGLNTAVAIAIHNFPEGLATFVATLADPTVGVTLAVAIAIHNIPEGLCVALPIYYATGSRLRGFVYALLSGLSEPIGAAIGYGIIKATGDDLDQTVYGVLFGIVGGMMVMIVILELLPTAFRYDPADTVVTTSLCAGMAVMAASLVMFQL